MNKRSFFLKALAVVILVLVGFFLGLGMQERLIELKKSASTPPQTEIEAVEGKPKTVSVMVDGDKDILAFPEVAIQTDDTVWSILKRLAETQSDKLQVESQDYSEMGILVTSINGLKGGQDNKYWQYWINNEYGQVSADKQEVKAGDVIMWKFTSSEFKKY